VADITSQGVVNTRWCCIELGLFLPVEVETSLAVRYNAHAASLLDSFPTECGREDPRESHCDVQSFAESVASAGTTLTAMSAVSRSTDLSQASSGADSPKMYIPLGLRKDMEKEEARKEWGEDSRGGGWRVVVVDRWGDRPSRGGGVDRVDRGGGGCGWWGGIGSDRWGDKGGSRGSIRS
jgi:hypothetical protein